MRVLLMGSTDTTLAVGHALIRLPEAVLVGLVHLPTEPRISYAPQGMRVDRRAKVPEWSSGHGIPALASTDAAEIAEFARVAKAEMCVVAGWYHMVPGSIRKEFPRGCYGLHASLLPDLRGGAPLNWAILTGRKETGVSLFELADGVDDGPIYGQVSFPIGERDSVADLIEHANEAAAALVAETLPAIFRGDAPLRLPQRHSTYGLQRQPSDGAIDWRWSAIAIDRLVRASGYPYAGAFTSLDGRIIRLWQVQPLLDAPPVYGAPGQLLRIAHAPHPLVLTGDGLLSVIEATDDDGTDVMSQLVSQRRFEQAQ